jgi:hypothetical protein
MKKSILLSCVLKTFFYTLILSNFTCFAQRRPAQVETSGRKLSEARTLMEKTDIIRVNKDWSLTAEFKSQAGEKVEFFPVEVVDQRTGVKMIALQVDLKIKTPSNSAGLLSAMSGMASGGGFGSLASAAPAMIAAIANDGVSSAWVDYGEIDRLIEFIENEVVPNLSKKYKKMSSEFIFQSQELTMRYLMDEDRKRISIILNNGEGNTPMYFFTEHRAEKIGELLPILKKVRSKELKFE